MTSLGFSGINSYVKFGSMVLTPYYRTAGLTEDAEVIETSSGNDVDKTYVVGDKDNKFDCEIVFPSGTAGTALWAAVAPRTSGSLEVGPNGTATNEQKHSALAIITSRGQPLDRADVITVSLSWQISGAVTSTAY